MKINPKYLLRALKSCKTSSTDWVLLVLRYIPMSPLFIPLPINLELQCKLLTTNLKITFRILIITYPATKNTRFIKCFKQLLENKNDASLVKLKSFIIYLLLVLMLFVFVSGDEFKLGTEITVIRKYFCVTFFRFSVVVHYS